MRICPLCNGLTEITYKCPRCNVPLKDNGRIEDFLDDYSPYLQQDLPNGYAGSTCTHLLYCPHCREDHRWEIPLV
ncbi:MAG: hypothetical protein GX764_03670 [Firmicutes bacterium]|nr:hypothetical protein [Bacillota bacterium]